MVKAGEMDSPQGGGALLHLCPSKSNQAQGDWLNFFRARSIGPCNVEKKAGLTSWQ